MNRLAVDHRAAHQVSPRQLAHRWHRRPTEGGDETERRPFHAKHLGVVCAAQASGIRGNRVKHRLGVGRRGRDHTQDLARRRLLLEGFRERTVASFELLEQPHVLNRDDGLGGEGFNKLDLLFPKRLDLAPPEADRANGDALPQQRHRQHGPERRLPGSDAVLCVAPNIVDVGGPPIQDRAAHCGPPIGR